MKSATHSPRASSRRFLAGLLGAPIAQSAAPAMHERAAEALDLRCHYQLIEVAGAGREQLKMLLEGVRRLGFAGINVTFPYKEAVLDLLDELSPGAALIGAVNTIIVRDGRLIGHNTDTTGFARAVTPLVTASPHGAVAVIGAGGVGKAIAFALAGLGIPELRIFDSDHAKAAQLAARLEGQAIASATPGVEDALHGVTGVVNASPVGMLPSVGTPVPDNLLHAELWVADAVYSPLWTPLLTAAKAKGACVMTGRELAIYQAADAFELFTGLAPSIAELGMAFDGVMAKRYAASSSPLPPHALARGGEGRRR
ncbi:shikimate dehydrogenase [Bradyrhizobium sediminis]|uniref:Shikimate dehydrogenase (NADP(+)) n=1 Tax=Bradyrhizobium sediminis TaxID=2840469 RepID=A0A975NZL8_9BRAD|nr:shikimate dehydrogenase [Bradyrhizobium sediminis]QWG23681.1 shikimate dehydrogenase [Bradyrhizobium sediminis]